ncbi:hypothetical protein [Pseudomonas sp. H1h]|uniref:hypothetical protein n=1 Tax=Pseudomonas sp. H1h TaxID=1397280 RepID=UPI00046A6093|nr:hypothetical protein [Pseudomonas sp. H1h]
MSSKTLEERSIKLSGIVTKDYCILASTSATSLRNGTVWTNKDSTVSSVISKNHQRLSDEQSLISIVMAPGDNELGITTTATAMFEVTSVGDHYLSTHRVTFKDFTHMQDNQWNATVYGTPLLNDTPESLIDPYVMLSEYQFFMAARVNDNVKDEGSQERISKKTYTKLANNLYINEIVTPYKTYANSQSFNNDDMFRTLASDDLYVDESAEWLVKEKLVYYLLTLGGIDFYGRELRLIKAAR